MIGKLNHIAIATPKLDEAVKTYKNIKTYSKNEKIKKNRKDML